MIKIQPEKGDYYTAIHEINVLGFGLENEARLVENLRKSPDFIPELSLVAVKDKRVVGHILFSHITIQTKIGSFPALALAPMAVHPEFQKQGIGSKLVRQGLERCRNLGCKVVIVVGYPNYYPRFGFTSARAKGLEAPFPVPNEAFGNRTCTRRLEWYFWDGNLPTSIRWSLEIDNGRGSKAADAV